MAADIDWIISNHGSFLERFGFNRQKIMTEYDSWKVNSSSVTTAHFFIELLRKVSLHNVKHAETEQEFATTNVEIFSRQLEVSNDLSREDRHFLRQQLHLNELMVSQFTLPFKFTVQIKSENCCPYCTKQDKKIYTLDKVIEKKYLPHLRCTNIDGCMCTYSIVPLTDI